MAVLKFLQRPGALNSGEGLLRGLKSCLEWTSIQRQPYHGGVARYGTVRGLSGVSPASVPGAGPVESLGAVVLSPAVRHLVETHNITDVAGIQASGPKNRLLKG